MNFEFSPVQFGSLLLITGICFVVLWYMDHKTHLAIWKKDITDGELRTHRMILYSSYGLLAGLVLLAVSPIVALPLCIGCFISRLTHEFIDELHWHLPRCTERETLIHLGMWVSVQTGTFTLFVWGFAYQYQGFLELPWPFYVGFAAVAGAMGWIGHHEIFDYMDKPREINATEHA